MIRYTVLSQQVTRKWYLTRLASFRVKKSKAFYLLYTLCQRTMLVILQSDKLFSHAG